MVDWMADMMGQHLVPNSAYLMVEQRGSMKEHLMAELKAALLV